MSVEQVLAHTPWGQFWLWPDDLIGRTVIGHNAVWAGTTRPFWGPDMKPSKQPVATSLLVDAPEGNFWDADLLLPAFDAVPYDSTVIDIGAYVGLNAVYLASRCRMIYAVEPVWWRELQGNLNANGVTNVSVIKVAAYDKPVKIGGTHVDDNRGAVALGPGTRPHYLAGPLDAQICPAYPVSLIKSDAQGCDLRALKGLRGIISKYRPKIIFEYERQLAWAHGDDWFDHEAFIKEINYTMEESKSNPCNYICLPRGNARLGA